MSTFVWRADMVEVLSMAARGKHRPTSGFSRAIPMRRFIYDCRMQLFKGSLALPTGQINFGQESGVILKHCCEFLPFI
ncbi:hypothetical protein [Rhizobium sp. HT1-10]|uniref:hypothetical protein n=1 Tax=Rhizobium sp. HT1-10 TaxID=3111638 RepID=UPI003C2740E4